MIYLLDLFSFFNDKTILVTGGTGSIGFELVNQLLNYNPRTIRILSNSENELWQTQLKLKDHISKLRFLLGDIRNFERVKRASQNVDYIFNAAAIKHVPLSEYNPMEAVNVNIHGLDNIIEAAFINNVKKVIHISTDKAVSPTTVMGATKMLGERLCLSRELTKGNFKTIISCVRFGNVLGSRGSIIPLIKKQIRTGDEVTLTDAKMKRFIILTSKWVNLILNAAMIARGGEIFVLKMPVVYIKDLIEAYIEIFCSRIDKNPENVNIKIIGRRLGEKLDEKLISSIELPYCYEIEDMYIIYPPRYFSEKYPKKKIIEKGIKINTQIQKDYSTNTQETLTKEHIKLMIEDFFK